MDLFGYYDRDHHLRGLSAFRAHAFRPQASYYLLPGDSYLQCGVYLHEDQKHPIIVISIIKFFNNIFVGIIHIYAIFFLFYKHISK